MLVGQVGGRMGSQRFSPQSNGYAMRRFKLSLRDIFVVVTVICVGLGMAAIGNQLTDDVGDFVRSLTFFLTSLTSVFCIAVALTDIAHHRPLLSYAIGQFASLYFLFGMYGEFDPLFLLFADTAMVSEIGPPSYRFATHTCAILIGLTCYWITRSMLPTAVEAKARGE